MGRKRYKYSFARVTKAKQRKSLRNMTRAAAMKIAKAVLDHDRGPVTNANRVNVLEKPTVAAA